MFQSSDNNGPGDGTLDHTVCNIAEVGARFLATKFVPGKSTVSFPAKASSGVAKATFSETANGSGFEVSVQSSKAKLQICVSKRVEKNSMLSLSVTLGAKSAKIAPEHLEEWLQLQPRRIMTSPTTKWVKVPVKFDEDPGVTKLLLDLAELTLAQKGVKCELMNIKDVIAQQKRAAHNAA